MPIIAVVGSRGSGKTTAIEALVRGLTKRNYRVATVKHIHQADFTINSIGKDTWRHAKAGASITISVAPKELAIIKKGDTTKYELSEILQYCEDEVDVVVLEGFRRLVKQDPLVPKVVAVKTADEVAETSKYFKPILAFVGSISTPAEKAEIPYVDVLQEPQKLVDIVEKRIASMVKKKRELQERLKIRINGKPLALNLFVQKIMRNVILSMISTLKGTTIRGNESIFINIVSAPRKNEY